MFCGGWRICAVLVLVKSAAVLSQGSGGCASGCVRVEHCAPAQALLAERTDASRQTLRDAFCQFDAQGMATVCCTKLVGDLDTHPSQRLLPANCGHFDGMRIVGGEEALLQEFPWMVLISYKTRGDLEFQCGGSLINERYVLTAAHCITDLGAKRIAGVRVGEHDILTDKDCQGDAKYQTCQDHLQDIRVEEIIPHEGYSKHQGTVRNDIGLLRLKKPVDLSFKNVGLVCLPTSAALRAAQLGGVEAVVTGWGVDDTGRQSNVLRKVKVKVHSDQACSDFWNRGKKSDATINKLCAGELGRDSCSGDSGGPLAVGGAHGAGGAHRLVQQGVVSYGPKQCGSEFPGVYTRVAPYMQWILDHIRP